MLLPVSDSRLINNAAKYSDTQPIANPSSTCSFLYDFIDHLVSFNNVKSFPRDPCNMLVNSHESNYEGERHDACQNLLSIKGEDDTCNRSSKNLNAR